jgi:trigger factor
VNSPDSVAVERPSAEVTDADIDAMIESMRRQRPVFTQVERPARATDRVTLDFDGRIDGEAFEGGEGRDVSVIVGSRQAMTELEEAVQGAGAGETRTVFIAFPAEHPNKGLAGRKAELQVAIKRVEEQSLPAVDEEFCRAYGVEEGNIEALRVEVRKSMERELADVIRNRVRTQVLDALYRENSIEVPRALIDEQVQQLQLDMARRMGVQDASRLPPREPLEEPARRRVALGLLMGQVVQAEGIRVDRERVQSRLSDLVATYPNPDEARRAYLQSQDAMRQIESAVLEDQVVDWVLGRARITDRPMSFKELTGFGQTSESQI